MHCYALTINVYVSLCSLSFCSMRLGCFFNFSNRKQRAKWFSTTPTKTHMHTQFLRFTRHCTTMEFIVVDFSPSFSIQLCLVSAGVHSIHFLDFFSFFFFFRFFWLNLLQWLKNFRCLAELVRNGCRQDEVAWNTKSWKKTTRLLLANISKQRKKGIYIFDQQKMYTNTLWYPVNKIN